MAAGGQAAIAAAISALAALVCCPAEGGVRSVAAVHFPCTALRSQQLLEAWREPPVPEAVTAVSGLAVAQWPHLKLNIKDVPFVFFIGS